MQHQILVIGISGGTGSGKTTFVNEIITKFKKDEICVISQDSYYKKTDSLSQEERTNINFDDPEAIDFNLLIKHLQTLKSGKNIEQPIYSFTTHNRTKETLTTIPKKVIIIEGILIFNNQKLRKLLDVKVFIDTNSDERLIRRIKRDITERGRDMDEVIKRYQKTLKPMHQKFIAPTKKFADIIIPNNKINTVALTIITTFIHKRL